MSGDYLYTASLYEVTDDSALIRVKYDEDLIFKKARTLQRPLTMIPGAAFNGNIAAKEVHVGYGCQVIGNVFGRDGVTIQLGARKIRRGGQAIKEKGVVQGSVVSSRTVSILEPPKGKVQDDYVSPKEPPRFEVRGNVMADTVAIGPNVDVYGNVIGKYSVEILEGSNVYGGVSCTDGTVSIGNGCTALDVYAANEIRVGLKVTLFDPCIWSKKKTILLEGPVRLIAGCASCGVLKNCEKGCTSSGDLGEPLLCSNTLHCSHFERGECPGGEWPILALTDKDIGKTSTGGSIATPWGRTEKVDDRLIQSILEASRRRVTMVNELPVETIRVRATTLDLERLGSLAETLGERIEKSLSAMKEGQEISGVIQKAVQDFQRSQNVTDNRQLVAVTAKLMEQYAESGNNETLIKVGSGIAKLLPESQAKEFNDFLDRARTELKSKGNISGPTMEKGRALLVGLQVS